MKRLYAIIFPSSLAIGKCMSTPIFDHFYALPPEDQTIHN
jgi:hypothetical protein